MRFLFKYLAISTMLFSVPVMAQGLTEDSLTGTKPYQSPSCSTTDHREMDFLLGTWDLKVMVDGRWVPGGFARHTSALGGCAQMALLSFENWGEFYRSLTGRTGYGVIALSSYDRQNRNWRQVWHDDMGSVVATFRGRKYQDGIRFVGPAPGETSAELQRFGWRVVSEHIREFTLEISTEGGTDWTEIAKAQLVRRH